MRSGIAMLALAACSALVPAARAEDVAKLEYHGVGWVQMGRIEKSFALPNVINDYNKNWIGNSGGFISATAKIGDDWEGALGIGAMLVHLARGNERAAHIWYPFWIPIIPEARLTYTTSSFREGRGLQVNLGSFVYDYNPDVKNLGLYLLRGYVYPGTLVSGFEDKAVIPVASIYGGMVSARLGGLRNDLILKSETDDRPFFDFSLADVVTWKINTALELGAGVNFYRLIPQKAKTTSPGKDCNSNQLGPYPPQGQENPCFIVEKDALGNVKDTVLGSLAGQKVMGRFRLDPKGWLGMGGLAPDDLVIYGEAAVLGLKDYPVYYDKILRRIPVMLGFNFPGWGIANMSMEVEYYASKISSDNLPAQNGAWLPTVEPAVNSARDDWKWSFYASRMFLDHMKLSLQFANDHTRLGGTHNDAAGAEALRIPKDWYWASKLAFFF
jgi:hypothetical protein